MSLGPTTASLEEVAHSATSNRSNFFNFPEYKNSARTSNRDYNSPLLGPVILEGQLIRKINQSDKGNFGYEFRFSNATINPALPNVNGLPSLQAQRTEEARRLKASRPIKPHFISRLFHL